MFTQNVNVARFAHNVEWDFFCDFQTPWWFTIFSYVCSRDDINYILQARRHSHIFCIFNFCSISSKIRWPTAFWRILKASCLCWVHSVRRSFPSITDCLSIISPWPKVFFWYFSRPLTTTEPAISASFRTFSSLAYSLKLMPLCISQCMEIRWKVSFDKIKLFKNYSKCRIWILAFSTNFSPIKTDLSGNTVSPQASGFQKLAKMNNFWHFQWTFVHSKM